MKKEVGQVTDSERNEIKTLFERRSGLSELAKIISPENDELYDRLVKDLGETSTKFQQWWDSTSSKYNWESCQDGRWEIDFDTCKIFLVSDI